MNFFIFYGGLVAYLTWPASLFTSALFGRLCIGSRAAFLFHRPLRKLLMSSTTSSVFVCLLHLLVCRWVVRKSGLLPAWLCTHRPLANNIAASSSLITFSSVSIGHQVPLSDFQFVYYSPVNGFPTRSQSETVKSKYLL